MNIQKLIEITAYILKRNDGILDYYNLIKECYMADRNSIERIGYAMTGDTYVSMSRGPVLESLYALIKGKYADKEKQTLWNDYFKTENKKIELKSDTIGFGRLSRFEENTLNTITQRFYGYSYEQMKEYAHREGVFPEWKPVENGEEKPITLKDIMKALKFSDEDIKVLIEEQQVYEKEELALCS